MTYKILIVDDEPVNLRTLSRLLRANYNVVTAESGEEALKLLQQHNVALLISDQRMPEMTGTLGWQQFLAAKHDMLSHYEQAKVRNRSHGVRVSHGKVAEASFREFEMQTRDWLVVVALHGG